MPEPGFFTTLAAAGVRGLTPYVPGKPVETLEREYGVRNALKLASNENPLGASPKALAALATLGDLARYPDGEGYALKEALAARHGVEAARITLGNGSNDVLVLIAEAFLGPGTEAIYAQYAFIVYALAVQATGATARVAPALGGDADQGLGHDLGAVLERITANTRVIFLANPNNPTGTWLGRAELRAFMASVPERVVVVVDEAYAEYATAADYGSLLGDLGQFPNLVVTRTFSKIYGLAGLRLGYAVSHPEVAELLNRVRQPFNVSTPAQRAGLAALADDAHVEHSRAENAHGRERLAAGLAALGHRVLPSMGNFVLTEMAADAASCYTGLLRAGIIVRPVANYGLPGHLRITVGTPPEVTRVLEALAALSGTSK